MLHGARQVGKTFILNKFGEGHYRNTVYINLEANQAAARFFSENNDLGGLVWFLETTANDVVEPGRTLIILDEIQSCEGAMASLKYFAENAPGYHVAAAGSLPGVALDGEHYPAPAQGVESMSLYPLDFEEFLWALEEGGLAERIRGCYACMEPLPEELHQRAAGLFRYYLIVGGMPACVQSFSKDGDTVMAPGIQNGIANNYWADMAKYTEMHEALRIKACYDSIPVQLASSEGRFHYKVVQKGGSASSFGAAVDWLIQTGAALKCKRVVHAANPIAVYEDLSSFKLYMNDVGLLSMRSGIPQQTILSGESNLFMGSVVENFIAQSLAANGHPLYYWAGGGGAELDFVLQKGTEIIGVKVKKRAKAHSKSLGVFTKKYHPAYSIRFSGKNFGADGTDGADGAEGDIRVLPYYAAFCV